MLSIYPACFFKEDTGYSVVFPDLNWLATDGKNETDAMKRAVDCLAGYLYLLKKDGDAIPKPSDLKDVSLESVARELDTDTREGFVNLVSVDVADYAHSHFEKAVKKTLSIPLWLNNMALEKKINFSQTLQEALMSKLHL